VAGAKALSAADVAKTAEIKLLLAKGKKQEL